MNLDVFFEIDALKYRAFLHLSLCTSVSYRTLRLRSLLFDYLTLCFNLTSAPNNPVVILFLATITLLPASRTT